VAGTANFPAGETEVAVNVPVANWADPGRPGSPSAAAVSATDSAGMGSVCFNYSTLQGTAQVGVDFVNTFGSACIPAGTTTLPVTVPLIGDLDPEADEDFSLVLTAVTNATVADGQATGVILNDDNPTDFYTVTPCRILDTRLSGPGVAANTVYNFAVAGLCGVPLTAKSVVVNITAVAPTDAGDLRLYPAGLPAPLAARAGLHRRPYAGGQRGRHPGRRREPDSPERHAGRLHGRHTRGGRRVRVLPVTRHGEVSR
jgi:Calx-beta domain